MIFLWVNFRCHYLENAIIQAKNASSSDGLVGSTHGAYDNGLLELLEGKLAVLRFQIKIKEELQGVVSRVEDLPGASESGGTTGDSNFVNIARGKAKELSLDLKSITQLYNDYAVPFELWEVLAFSLLPINCAFLRILFYPIRYNNFKGN